MRLRSRSTTQRRTGDRAETHILDLRNHTHIPPLRIHSKIIGGLYSSIASMLELGLLDEWYFVTVCGHLTISLWRTKYSSHEYFGGLECER